MTAPQAPRPPVRLLGPLPSAPRPTRSRPSGDRAGDLEATAHELHLHRIERDLQLEELQRKQAALEAARDRYLDLYDFAPVGYVTLDDKGLIVEANLTAATLLGETRASLLDSEFAMRLAPAAREVWYRHLTGRAQRHGVERIELTLVHADGHSFDAQLDCLRVTSPGLPAQTRLTLIDVTERRRLVVEVERLAFHDALTGLPNRRLMRDRLFHALAVSARTGHSGALMFVDLDRFKAVNDGHGHAAGDRLLRQVAHRLADCVREGDTVARAGGDEFVVILAGDLSGQTETAVEQAAAVATKILDALQRPYELAGDTYSGSASLGLVVFNDHAFTVDELLERADQAMYQAKGAGRNTYRVFDRHSDGYVPARGETEVELLHALAHGEFVLHYRPVVDVDMRLLGGQIVVRWRDPGRGLMPTDALMASAQDQELIHVIGLRALDAACARLAAWAAEPEMAALTLTLTLTAAQWHAPDFVERVIAALDSSGAPAARLRLELAEATVHERIADCMARMAPLNVRGVGLSLSDFGVRHASFGHFKRLPLSQLKLSPSFAREAPSAPSVASVVRMALDLGRRSGLLVVADGVDSIEQRDCLARMGCRAFQGDLFGPPRSARSLREMLQSPPRDLRATGGDPGDGR